VSTTISDPTATDSAAGVQTPGSLPVPQLFVLLRCDALRAPASRHALSHIDELQLGRGDRHEVSRKVEAGKRVLCLRLPDPRMSRSHARLTRQGQGWLLTDLGSSNGTRVDGVRIDCQTVPEGACLELGQSLMCLHDALPTPAHAPGDLASDALGQLPPALRTLLPELAVRYEQLARVARSPVPVLILGETGTGKEWLARAVHELSGRRGSFVAVNCGALPVTLLEALLFGHVRGAFSGATRDELGYVRAADGGTLFLDEIGDLPAASQTALLRVLQEGEVVPVGTTRPVAVDLRVVSATHAPLAELAERGSFRNDLYSRLCGFSFRAPALRERLPDLGLVLGTLAPELEQAAGGPLSLTPEAARLLLGYDWPRNLRELRQYLAAAAVLAEQRVIAASHLPEILRQPRAASQPPAAAQELDGPDLERELIRQFTEHRGNVTQVARAMGKARVQIQRWMKRFAIDPARYR
jgi:transcriptional regulator of acetoin/glycerol metabolism